MALIIPNTIETETPKETVGAAALRLQAQGDQNQSVVETQREMQKKYVDSLIECALDGAKRYGKEHIFYVCVQTRRDRLLTNVIRNQFYTRQTRPMPTYDLALYHYEPKAEQLRFVWCIPDKQTCEEMMHPDYRPPQDHLQLYGLVKAFMQGTLI